jgi:hypothetical protein
MIVNLDKLKALVLYVIWRTGHYPGFGATKLNKVLWFSDARAFQAFGKSITGEIYIRQKFGPVPEHISAVCDELEQQGTIEQWSESVFDHNARRYRAFQPADTSPFSDRELGFIDWWIRHVAEEHTAHSISELSHDYAWAIAGLGERFPLHAFLATRISQPNTEEMAWAQAEAERLGLT